jgi:predicted transposase YbfD/YdcC
MSESSVSSILFRHFSILPDPRIDRRKLHKLYDILVIALCGTLCGVECWEGLELYAESREEWFRRFLELPNGIPSHDTFERVMSRLDPERFQHALVAIASDLREVFSEEIIAIDGKTVRGSRDSNTRALHLVSAYSVDNGLTLAQVATDAKSNEITAIPELLDLIDVRGAIVTIDAAGCQTNIAEKIVQKKGDYVLAVKANQASLHRQLKEFFEERSLEEFDTLPSTSVIHHVEKGHGRLEERSYVVTSDTKWIEGFTRWKGAQSVGMVLSKRTVGKKTTTERRFYLGSIDPDAKLFARAVREHWAIEAHHHLLDVTFNEDARRVRREFAPQNLATLRRIAANLLKQDTQSKRSVRLRKLQALWQDGYLERILRHGVRL